VSAQPSPTERVRADAVVGPTREAPSPAPSASPSATASAGDPAQAKRKVAASAAAYADDLFAATNVARTAAGQHTLVRNECAVDLAAARVAEAISVPGLRIEPVDHTCTERRVGEAMARNFGTSEAMFNAWMANVDLKQNVLRPEYTQSGVACVAYSAEDELAKATSPEDIGGYVCSQVFLRIVP
jgi:uncharacterized protein YkwD